ncbi:glycosyltransferase family 2 protein [Ignatzschineria cameli]|uniref:Glycosyltransferase 2-like domain-containing protein n=1 Tax=Ignatzschineria cameli TaxID=2182793 RepID=A0A2U2AQL2_9GAMM|nr:glycosyltransferase family 2 protein [Ignatzschineria cameli]PWD86178.1 hypothetical protein DC077_05390 [Ignatzschineria cameli]
MKISVIVPVYKVEKYIEKCLQSLLDQTYTDFEALIIDDGSPDGSIAVAKKLVGDDSRFIFLEKENGGLSSARNYGLKYARGEYIAFLDSDDYFTNNCFQECIKIFDTNPNVEIVLFGINLVSVSGKILGEITPNLDAYYQQSDILLTKETINYSVWSKIYKSDIWKNRWFVEGIIYEDKEIIPAILYEKKLFAIDEPLYNYVQRPGSIMNTYNSNSLSSLITIYKGHLLFLKENRMYSKYEDYYKASYLKYCLYSQALEITKYSTNFYEDRFNLISSLDPSIVNTSTILYSFKNKPKYLLGSLLFLKSPKLFKFIFNILKR